MGGLALYKGAVNTGGRTANAGRTNNQYSGEGQSIEGKRSGQSIQVWWTVNTGGNRQPIRRGGIIITGGDEQSFQGDG